MLFIECYYYNCILSFEAHSLNLMAHFKFTERGNVAFESNRIKRLLSSHHTVTFFFFFTTNQHEHQENKAHTGVFLYIKASRTNPF